MAEVAPAPLPAPPSELTIVSIADGGLGRGYNLTEEIEGLTYSNIDPGGDEVASFTLHRPWFSLNPEIARGNLLRVMSGIDVLWVGRIEESDRSATDSETIVVTAYGLGVRLKDGEFAEIFIDRDLTSFGDPSADRRRIVNEASYIFQGETQVAPHDKGQKYSEGIIQAYQRLATAAPPFADTESWYYGAGIELGEIRYDAINLYGIGAGDASWNQEAGFSKDDVGTGFSAALDYNGTSAFNQAWQAPEGYFYVLLINQYVGTFTGDGEWAWLWGRPRIYGRHGLASAYNAGNWWEDGFTIDQMIGFIVEQVPGVAVRRLDHQPYVVQHSVFKEPVPHEDAISDLNRYENCDWGTWGPDSPLDNTVKGYFDLKTADRQTQHWFVQRSDCADLDLHSESATLYGEVDVVYEDEAGITRRITVSIDVPDLDAAGMTRKKTLTIGQATAAIATTRGESFLAIWGQFAPARGSFTVSNPVRHYRRGLLNPSYMRADGSNVRIPDILPAETLFALDATPDLRTTFPIKRVTIDAGGPTIAANVEVDQADDSLSVLQARSDLAEQLLPS